MKISDLQLILEDNRERYGDIEVCVYADHGQDTTFADCTTILYHNKEEFIGEVDVDPGTKYEKVLEIS